MKIEFKRDVKFNYNEKGELVAYKDGKPIGKVITMGDDVKKEKEEQKKEDKKITKSPKKTSEDFKRKYFEFYDDIKISDRQDW